MTGILLQECNAQRLKGIVESMDNVEWQRFFRSLTGASSAQGILAQKTRSLLGAVQRGGELLEGSDFRRASIIVASDVSTQVSAAAVAEDAQGVASGTRGVAGIDVPSRAAPAACSSGGDVDVRAIFSDAVTSLTPAGLLKKGNKNNVKRRNQTKTKEKKAGNKVRRKK